MSRKPGSKEMLSVARGESPADISVVGGKVFSPATKEWIETSLSIKNGFIVAWAEHEAHDVIDVKGAYISPGFIDAYTSLESSKLWLDAFVDTVLPCGTTAVAADPFQLSNVFGIRGIEELAGAGEKMPFTLGIYASSYTQSSHYDSTGEHASAVEIAQLLRDYGAIGVGGLLNSQSIVNGDEDVLAKIAAARSQRVVGHGGGLSGSALDAYLCAGVESDGSALRHDEALEKLRKGMWIFLRNGTIRNNLRELLPLVKRYGTRNMAFCTSERELETIMAQGHINHSLRIAVEEGIPAEDALLMASTNPAQFHGFSQLGYLSPGYQADFVVLPNLEDFQPSMVFQRGTMMARSGKTMAFSVPKLTPSPWMVERAPVDLTRMGPEAFSTPEATGQVVPVIQIRGTDHGIGSIEMAFQPHDRSISRLAVLGRKGMGKDLGMGLVEGFGITEGAIATTVARGPHSLMALGASSESGAQDMALAVATLVQMGGGQVVVKNKQVIAALTLSVGGIMSTNAAPELLREIKAIEIAAHSLGITIERPLQRLEMLALAVMPELRITNLGSINVLNLVNMDPLQFN